MHAAEPQRPPLEIAPKVARREGLPADQVEPAARLFERHPGGVEHEAVWIGNREVALPGGDVERPNGGEPALALLVHLGREHDQARIEDGDPRLFLDLTNDRFGGELAGLEPAGTIAAAISTCSGGNVCVAEHPLDLVVERALVVE